MKKVKRKKKLTKRFATFKYVCRFVAPVGYLVAVLVLFQFVSLQLVLRFYSGASSQRLAQAGSNTPEKKPQEPARAATTLPVRLEIPSLRINAVVRSVGVMPDGSMGVPKLPNDTAWYMLGPKPGEKGSAVIAGHVDWWYGATGVFKNLKTLKPGDVITVQDDKGTRTSFVVRKSRIYTQQEDASGVFHSYDGKSHLNLITCAGVWDRFTKAYSKRLVVFTDKVEE